MMKREFTTREKVLLVVLVVLMITVGYFKFILTPINNGVEACQDNAAAEQDEISRKMAFIAEMNKMQKKTEEIKASGVARAIPRFDNSTELMKQLDPILENVKKYDLVFGVMTAEDYIMMRPAELSFTFDSYEQAREIIDALYDADSIVKISDMDIDLDRATVSMKLTYYELIAEEK